MAACRLSRTLSHRLLLLGVLGLFACSESVGPSSHPGPSLSASNTGFVVATGITFAPSAPPLATYDTSFVVTVEKKWSGSVFFADGRTEFLRLSIPKDAEFFDAAGNPLPKHGTVRLTLHIDPVYASFQFGPHGSLFLGKKGPASMCLAYSFLAFGGQTLSDLSVWYQPESGSGWTALDTQFDIGNKWLCTSIYHFSNYAIAY